MANGPQSRGDTYYGIDELSLWFPRWDESHRSVKVLVCPTDDQFVAIDQRIRTATNPDVCTFNTIDLEETRVNYKGSDFGLTPYPTRARDSARNSSVLVFGTAVRPIIILEVRTI